MSDERIAEAIKYTNALKTLIKSDGWKIIIDIANENIYNRTQQIVLEPSSSMDDMLPKEFMKGEVAGFTAMLALPDHKIAECDALINSFKEKDDGEEEEDSGGRDLR